MESRVKVFVVLFAIIILSIASFGFERTFISAPNKRRQISPSSNADTHPLGTACEILSAQMDSSEAVNEYLTKHSIVSSYFSTGFAFFVQEDFPHNSAKVIRFSCDDKSLLVDSHSLDANWPNGGIVIYSQQFPTSTAEQIGIAGTDGTKLVLYLTPDGQGGGDCWSPWLVDDLEYIDLASSSPQDAFPYEISPQKRAAEESSVEECYKTTYQ